MKKTRMAFLIALAAGGVTLLAFGLVNSRIFTETPAYQVVQKEEEFEIRIYEELPLVSAQVEGPGQPNSLFRRLFAYISGENSNAEKIAMTTPVLMLQPGQQMQSMAFILPVSKTGNAPAPTGEVELTTFASGRYAALRFSTNGLETETARKAADTLLGFLKVANLRAQGDPIIAYYDPPWTPSFLRRNEVLIRLAD